MADTSSDIRSALHHAEGLSEEAITTLANDPHRKELDEPCRQCGRASVVCCHAELGGSLDYRDHFAHVCLNPSCGHVEHTENATSLGQETFEDQLCCFCGRDVLGFRDAAEASPTSAVKQRQ